MSLHIPRLFTREDVYDERGMLVGYIVAERGMRPGETLVPVNCPSDDPFLDAIDFAKEASNAVRYD